MDHTIGGKEAQVAGIKGQGRRFDVDSALDSAMREFWMHGYEGTTIATLTEAMNIRPPSLYAAFGGKQELFDRVVQHYNSGVGGWMARAFEEEQSVASLIERLLRGAAGHYAAEDTPPGCLVITAATCVADANDPVAQHLRAMRNENIDRLAGRLRRARDDGELAGSVDPRSTADFVGATIQGMSQQARDGVDTARLRAIADVALGALGFVHDRLVTPAQ